VCRVNTTITEKNFRQKESRAKFSFSSFSLNFVELDAAFSCCERSQSWS